MAQLEQNPYSSICVDLTYACNMSCTFCYNPIRDIPSMDLSYFGEVCKRIPNRVLWKFLGGEPTLHPQFFEFIKTAYKHGDHVYFSSNGIKYNDKKFMQELKDLNLPFRPGLTLDGGCWHKNIYKAMGGDEKFANIKRKAFYNLIENDFKNITLSAIIVRGLNEHVISEILLLAYKYSKNVKYIHFRTAAMLGDWEPTEPYKMPEFIELIKPHFTEKEFQRRAIGECQNSEGKDCCYRFRPRHHLQVSLIEFATEAARRCPHRGKLIDQKYELEQFFENMVKADEDRQTSDLRP
jgi:uncharacterized radical SAM superfamily Fe-S cluster-containing enzyme